jgi:hypothetical protein
MLQVRLLACVALTGLPIGGCATTAGGAVSLANTGVRLSPAAIQSATQSRFRSEAHCFRLWAIAFV